MTVQSANLQELLLPGLRKIYTKHLDPKKDFIPVLFNRDDSTKAAETHLGMGALGKMDAWNSATGVSYEDFAKGFKKTYTHSKLSKGVKLERELFDDDQYGEVKKRIRALADVVHFTRQYDAASLFNNAFNGANAGPDGVALCANNHPLAPDSGSTFSNVGALALTADNVETVRTAMKAWTDDKSNLLGVTPDMLIVPSALRKAALVIADSDKEPDTSDNNVNVWKGTLKVVEFDWLTDANAWFMVDSSRMKHLLHWFDRRKAILESDDDFDSEELKYKVVGRWSFGFDDPTFIYGNNPS